MREKLSQFNLTHTDLKDKSELRKTRDELFEDKKQNLEDVKAALKETFGQEKLPEELVAEMVAIRKEILNEIKLNEYVDEINESISQKIKWLMVKICYYKNGLDNIQEATQNEKGDVNIIFKDGKTEPLGNKEQELLKSLNLYFDAYRLTYNAVNFKRNLTEIEDFVIEENKARTLNFYSKEEKEEVVFERLQKKYKDAGFSEEELRELITISNLEKISDLEVHDIKLLSQIKNIFSRFMKGDVSKYIALSAALAIPAFIDGYTPMLLSNAFKGSAIDMTQIGLYASLSSVAAGGKVMVNKYFKDFLNRNYSKEGGVDEYVADNISELPPEEITKFGAETIKKRSLNARSGYEKILKMMSFDIVPASITMGASVAMLSTKSPELAAGTVAGTGLMLILEKYFHKKGKFWKKERKSEIESEEVIKKIEEQLNAHMEIILSGEKESFAENIQELLAREKVASSEKEFLQIVIDNFDRFYSALNMVAASIATYFAGGSPDKFIAALAYSGQLQNSFSKILDSKRKLLSSLRQMMQMDLMFNGYAEEEAKKEEYRIGASEVENNNISLKNVNVNFENKQILKDINLDIPEGSMASLSGLSGAGKTTLMKVISGYYKPTSGEVNLGGVDMDKIKKSGEDSIYNRIAYLSQFPYILDDSIRNNLTFGIKNRVEDEQLTKILQAVRLSERFNNLNEKLIGGRGDLGATSGGESSRIGLARVLLKIRNSDSKIVFLDEPTASVDEETSREIANIINQEKRERPNVTFIVISHDKDFVKMLNCDTEVKMKKGEILK